MLEKIDVSERGALVASSLVETLVVADVYKFG